MTISIPSVPSVYSNFFQKNAYQALSNGQVNVYVAQGQREQAIRYLKKEIDKLKSKLAPLQKEYDKQYAIMNSNQGTAKGIIAAVKVNDLNQKMRPIKNEIHLKMQELVYWQNQVLENTFISSIESPKALKESRMIALPDAINNAAQSSTTGGTSGLTFLERLGQWILNILSKLFPPATSANVSHLA